MLSLSAMMDVMMSCGKEEGQKSSSSTDDGRFIFYILALPFTKGSPPPTHAGTMIVCTRGGTTTVCTSNVNHPLAV